MTDTAAPLCSAIESRGLLRRHGIFLNDPDRISRVGFLFPGHGSQYLDMLAELIGRHRAITSVFDEVDAAYRNLTGRDLTASFLTSRGGSAQQLADPEVMQPAIYAASMALYRAVTDLGLAPELMLGHSLGEYAALTAAGAMTLVDGVRATHARGVAVKGLPRDEWGSMVAVTVAGADQQAALQTSMLLAQVGRPATLTRSIENAHDLVVVTGPNDAVASFRKVGEQRGLSVVPLPVTHAFHSPVLAPCVPGLEGALVELAWSVPTTPVLSSVLGRCWAPDDIGHLPQLLAQQLVTPFTFAGLVDAAVAAGIDTFVEVGPKAILSGLVDRRPGAGLVTVPSNIAALGAEESLRRVTAFARAEHHAEQRAHERLADGATTLEAVSDELVLPTPTSPAPREAEHAPPVDRATVMAAVIDAFAAKTGYPAELIEPDLDLEADLGIDSVKQAEVLAELFPGTDSLHGTDLSTITTVTAIVDLLTTVGSPSPAPTIAPDDRATTPPDLSLPPIPVAHRYVTSPASRSLVDADRGTGFDPTGRTVLVLADPLGTVAVAVRQRLSSAGRVVLIAAAGTPSAAVSDEVIDWLDLDGAAAALASLHSAIGEVDAVIDLCGLTDTGFSAPSTRWASSVDTGFAASFLTAREVYGDLRNLGSSAAYLAATRIGEVFAMAGGANHGSPLGALQCGFVKSLSRELPEPHMKVVDVSPDTDETIVADLLITELDVDVRSDDLEVGYLGTDRYIVKLIPASLSEAEVHFPWAPTPGTVVLMSGGSRGITLECAKAVAEHSDVTVVVLGRTPKPVGTESWARLSDEDWAEARSDIMREQRILHPDWPPVLLAQEYERLGHARKLATTIDSFPLFPGRIVYRACDVADADAVRSTVDEVAAEYGPISLVVHGAGLESLGAVPKKPVEHSVEVVRVKARGLHNLWHAVAGQPVERFVSFGSVSGRGGMDGQVDYTAGCALLSVVSGMLGDARSDCHVSTIGWTAWGGTGMADHPTVRKVQEQERKMAYLDIDEGVRHFEREIGLGCDSGEVVYTGQLGSNRPRAQLSALSEDGTAVAHPLLVGGGLTDAIHAPMLATASVDVRPSGEPSRVRADRVISRSTDLYLDDHLVTGHATFPGVFHIETQAEAARLLAGGRYPVETRDVHLDQFLRIRPGAAARTWVTAAVVKRSAEHTVVESSLHSAFEAPNGRLLDGDRVHSGCTFVYATRAPAPTFAGLHLPDLVAGARPLDMDRYYAQASASITFGPTFRYLTKVALHGPTELVCELRTPLRPRLLARTPTPRFLGAPLVIDNVGRAALMWALHARGLHVVPRRITRAQLGRPALPGERLFGIVRIVEGSVEKVNGSSPSIHCDLTVTDADDMVICSVRDIQLQTVATSPDGPHDLLS